LVDHGADDGLEGLLSALGGKWTTSRNLAERITDKAATKLGAKTRPCTTATTPLPGGRFERFEAMAQGAEKTWPGIASMRHLSHMYGSRLPELLKGAKVSDIMPLGPSQDTLAQIQFAVREEMAMTLADAVMRRTSLGQFGPPPQLEKAAALMASLLDWDAARTQREIGSLSPLYRTSA
jgi:glycerol-3-phosphate dehydrogenase